MRAVLLLVVLGCGAAADPPVETCEPAPAGFKAERDGELVRVTKRLDTAPRQGGIRLFSEARVVDATTLPASVDFGAELLEVREDLSLCMLPR
jgi:hypothetical protein